MLGELITDARFQCSQGSVFALGWRSVADPGANAIPAMTFALLTECPSM